MSIRSSYFELLEHLGATVPVRVLYERPTAKNVVALRHDIDHDLDLALELACHEHERGVRATYYLLHSQEYWQDDDLLLKCRQLEAYGHEVGLHVNLIAEWFDGTVADIDARLNGILRRLREAGVDVVGVSSHGDRACYRRGFINYWIWRELRGDNPAARETGLAAEGVAVADPAWQIGYPGSHTLQRDDGTTLALWRCSLTEHALAYDAMHVPMDHYWTDSGGNWHRCGDPREADLRSGRHQVLTHPVWWRGPQRRYWVMSTAGEETPRLADFVNRATSCAGYHDETPEPTAGDEPSPIASLLRAAVTRACAATADVLVTSARLVPHAWRLTGQDPDGILLHLHRDPHLVVDERDVNQRFQVPVPNWEHLTEFERTCWRVRYLNECVTPLAFAGLGLEPLRTHVDGLAESLRTLGIVVHPLLAARFDPAEVASGASREWSDRMHSDFDRICGPLLRKLGYAEDDDEATTFIGMPVVIFGADYAKSDVGSWHAMHAAVTRDDEGLAVRLGDDVDHSAHVLLAAGRWHEVARADGVPVDAWSYYRCRLAATGSAGAQVRLFVVWYDETGAHLRHEMLGTLPPDDRQVSRLVAAPVEASHCAFAVHLCGSAPHASVTVRALSVEVVPFGTASGIVDTSFSAAGTASERGAP